MINTEDFKEQLLTTGSYQTSDRVERKLTDRWLGWSNRWYHWRVFGVITKGGRMYRQGQWERDSWLDLSLDMWRGVEGCGGRFSASGCQHLGMLESPAVIVANHMSLLETFSIPAMVLPFWHMTFVVKESLTRLPLFRDVMNGVRPISVKRQNPREDFKTLMDEGPAVLESGRCVVVFPQSTRSREFQPEAFNTVGAKLAKKANVPLVPLALKTDFHGLGKVVRDFGPVHRERTVHFEFGPPVEVTGNGREAHEESLRFIASALDRWGVVVREESNDISLSGNSREA